MQDVGKKLSEHLKCLNASPFLFLGSGFSRRYLGLEDWEGLLRRFLTGLKPFEYYKGKVGGQMAQVASLIAKDYHEYWWSDESKVADRKTYAKLHVNASSPLKIEIARYLKGISNRIYENESLKSEVAILSRLNVDGVITTNWDLLCESIFPGYTVYIGQEPLLASQPHCIGEIYKIHGCCSQPNSLVLTEDDYRNFNEKQAYLAAKLITIFVEHPVVFLGYSISDPNVISLLKSIVVGLGESQAQKMRSNLIFVQRSKPERPARFENNTIVVGDLHLPVINVVADDFIGVYEAIEKLKRKLPARVIRFCKEQFYDLVRDEDPKKKLHVVDYDDIESNEGVEFVVGVGVINEHLSRVGYESVGVRELFRSLIAPESLGLDARSVLNSTVPSLARGRRRIYLPVFCFLKQVGICGQGSYDASGYELGNIISSSFESYRSPGFARAYNLHCKGMSIDDLIDKYPVEKAAAFIPHMSQDLIDIDRLRRFLADNFELLFSGTYSTSFRKLACLLDFLENSWHNNRPRETAVAGRMDV